MALIRSVSYPTNPLYQAGYVEVSIAIAEASPSLLSHSQILSAASELVAGAPPETIAAYFPAILPVGTLVDYDSVTANGELLVLRYLDQRDPDTVETLVFTETLTTYDTYRSDANTPNTKLGVQPLDAEEQFYAPSAVYQTFPTIEDTSNSFGEMVFTAYVPIELAESVGLTIPEAPPGGGDGGGGDAPPMKVNITCQWQRFYNSYALIPSGSNTPNPTQDDVTITTL